ncbi:hypothetical protein CAPTEDRAFT_167069 [Capitella teleta]|uniref:Checkpoint protein n=1 Tax=Capitella teleta TaxID=283909 RepID=R7UB68_CAPTE|nr:hypothetical protein CAPTEDRAFT_167069 [Capitella teleta]|eukprot:ELU00492.1 hypothetical protein CAPTEDRAFT_167069 [Capitella teleta]
MRFRGKIIDIGCIQHFTRVVTTISKLVKSCTLRITTDTLYFILSERMVTGGTGIWCQVSQNHFFDEFNLDGVSAEANEIYLEVNPDLMVRALRTAQNAKSVKIKLTKKHMPCLTLEVELPTLAAHSRLVTHDVPVNVIPRRLWDEFEEPELPDFDVTLFMPCVKILRNVVDRMKNLSNFLTISANNSGEMNFGVSTDIATIKTHFKDVGHPNWRETSDRDPKEFADARIDIRKLAQFLVGQQLSSVKIICNLVHEHLAHFFIVHDDVSLQYSLPVVNS